MHSQREPSGKVWPAAECGTFWDDMEYGSEDYEEAP
jgi:hypothetical protein